MATEGPEGPASLRIELPRGEWTLDQLHDLGRSAAESANVLNEETTAVDIAVAFPELETLLLDRLSRWYGIFRLVRDRGLAR